jgi:hypothetical protein
MLYWVRQHYYYLYLDDDSLKFQDDSFSVESTRFLVHGVIMTSASSTRRSLGNENLLWRRAKVSVMSKASARTALEAWYERLRRD